MIYKEKYVSNGNYKMSKWWFFYLRHVSMNAWTFNAIVLFNKWHSKKSYPQNFKWFIVKPLYTKGGKSSAHNYRPVALILMFTLKLD